MSDFVRSKEWRRPPLDPGALIRVIDEERLIRSPWRDLAPDHLDAELVDGNAGSFETVEQLTNWLDRHAGTDPRDVFVRWTEGGEPASTTMARIAVRIGSPTTVWVGCPEEERTLGLIQLIERAVERAAQTPPNLPGGVNRLHLGSRDEELEKHQPTLPATARDPKLNIEIKEVHTGSFRRPPLYRRILDSQWTITIVGGAIAGILLLVITQLSP